MTGKGHTMAGIICSMGTYQYLMGVTNGSIAASVVAGIATIFGSTAPDWMECRKKNGGTLINHRTWTHWTMLWVLAYVFAFAQFDQQFFVSNDITNSIMSTLDINMNIYIASALLGFVLGGFVHLVTDLPNPMGVPILTPYHRFSLKLWKSGKNENFVCFTLLIVNLCFLGILKFDLTSLI